MNVLHRTSTKWLILVVLAGAAFALWPLVGRSVAPTLVNGLVVLFFAYAWNIVGGILGELALSSMLFWGIGSYAMVLSLNAGTGMVLPILGAAVVCAVLGAVIVRAAAALGLTGLYLAVFTLIIYEIAAASVTAIELIGRNEGIIIYELTSVDLAAYLLLGLVFIAIAVNLGILSSPMGRRWLSIKDDATAAQAVGVRVGRERMIAYAISGGLTAIGGGVQAYYLGYAQPETALGIDLLISGILAVFVGGAGTVAGPFIGTVVVFGLEAVAINLSTDIQTSLYAQILQYVVAFAIIWMLSARKGARRGVVGLIKRMLRRISGRSTDPTAAVEEVHVTRAEIAELAKPPAPPSDVPPAVEVIGVSKRFGGLEVLKDVTIAVRPGEIVGLMGPNGAGKTTVCNVITGVIQPDTDSVRVLGDDVTTIPTPLRYTRGVARSFQAARLFTSLTALDNVLVGGANRTRAREVLEEYGLAHVRATAGAQTFVRRLIEICRLVAADKPVLLLDEPLAGLTADQQALVLQSVERLAASGCAVLLIEHLIQSIAPVCHRLIVMADGAVIAEGLPAEVLAQEQVVDAYLGAPLEGAS